MATNPTGASAATPAAVSASTTASALERNLRLLRKNISGVANLGKAALEDQSKVSLFKASLSCAETDWDKFERIWLERDALSASLGSADPFPDQNWLDVYKSLRYEIIQSKASLLTIQEKDSLQSELSNRPSGDISQLNATTSNFSTGNLPKIPIPFFSGDLLKWSHFKDTFTSLIDNDLNLTPVQKFHYLIGALKGEASSLLSKFPIDSASYPLAWAKLLETYDDKRVLAALFVQRILDCNIRTVKGDLQRYQSFMSEVADNIAAFRSLKLADPTEFLLAALALRSLDTDTRRHFELSRDSKSGIPTADDVVDFVRQRMSALKLSQNFGQRPSESSTSYNSSVSHPRYPSRGSAQYNSVSLHATGTSHKTSPPRGNYNRPNSAKRSQSPKISYTNRDGQVAPHRPPAAPNVCSFCSGNHLLPFCHIFADLPRNQRIQFIHAWVGCHNCLRTGHKAKDCPSKWSCRFCKGRHHSLIHEIDSVPQSTTSVKASVCDIAPTPGPSGTFIGFGSSRASSFGSGSLVLLGTVQTLIKDIRGCFHPVRAILDSGSQHTFMTWQLARNLQFPLQPFTGRITGLGGSTVAKTHGCAPCKITPCGSALEYSTRAIVVDNIAGEIPSTSIPHYVLNDLADVPLADHQFGTPSPVDILIGCDLYPKLLTGPPVCTSVADLSLLPTVFGQVVMGRVVSSASSDTCSLYTLCQEEVEHQLKMFWEIEEPATVNREDPEDSFCESHFEQTHYRTAQGRYVVELPLKQNSEELGVNRELVTKRFCALEKKLSRDRFLSQSYSEFMKEYRSLGHMSPARSESQYVIPHHGIWQERPGGKKLRVVFDASCPSSNMSLNDVLMTGPKLQNDICNILINFRLFLIPVCADLVKMYRQVLVHPAHRHLQHILWRENPSDNLKEFELNTITYGLKPSAFLAMRAIKQLVLDEGASFPLAANRIASSMYVDDIVTGANSPQEALTLKHELESLFSKGGFTLDKWASTLPEIVSGPLEAAHSLVISEPNSDSVKILGLRWNPLTDSFSYVALAPPSREITKRIVLSAVARIFDPLGLLAPVILSAKAFLQEIWKRNLGWDDTIPQELAREWTALVEGWTDLSLLQIPRFIGSDSSHFSIVGFCDASKRGYAAAVYYISTNSHGQAKVSLIKAKTKVAPVKYVSIARLELCAALLLARTLSSINIHCFDNFKLTCFSDSAVVLAWLRTPVHQLSVFEANRVSAILAIAPLSCWQYVKSEDNPSDQASRGCLPKQLIDSNLWWHGPSWLCLPFSEWPNITLNNISPNIALHSRLEASPVDKTFTQYLFSRFSSFRTLLRTIVRILRFAKRSRPQPIKLSSPINNKELHEAKLCIIRLVQNLELPKELYSSQANVPKPYRQLCPFVDEDGIVKVGGRLHNAPIPRASRHPMLLPKKSPLARLIIDHIHERHFHSGPSLTLALLRNEYWVPSAVSIIRGRISQCVPCRIRKAKPTIPIMSPLPSGRFAQQRAFLHVGLDYAGPFLIKESSRRKAPIQKAYLCIFICLSSKAVHLETVSSMTTISFLAALDRFSSRRGLPQCFYSDNGTNFVGASRFIKDVLQFLKQHREEIIDHLSPVNVEWKFNPPHAPHFGGLWEAGVKSAKSLLNGSVAKQPYTFEELATIFTRVEGLLNSRPLCPLTEDPEKCDFLTPGHFLIGGPLTSIPEVSDMCPSSTPISRWRSVQEHLSIIWERWRKEYLHTLQQRAKWHSRAIPIKIGDLVVLNDRRSVLGQWPVARVMETHPGKDGETRVVTVRTPSGSSLVRAVSSLVPLFAPLSKDEES